MKVVLDGRIMVSREAAHDLLAKMLKLPDYYGRNLDALYDVISDCTEDLDITVVHADVMLDHLGSYGNALLKTFIDASQNFERIDFSVSNEII